MTTLDNGIVIDESLTAQNQTSAANVPAVFGQPRVITSITQHHWGGLGQDYDAVTNGLAGNNARQVSAHFTAMDGRVSCLVSPENAAWHAGNPVGNATSIGIEMRPEATDGDYATAASLIRYLRGIYGDIPLVPHNHWFATACPGVWDLARLDTLARAGTITAQGTITTQEPDMPTAAEVVDELLNRTITGDDGQPVKVLWILQSFHSTAAAQAQAVAKAVLKYPIKNVRTGGTTDLETETGWGPQNWANIPAAVWNATIKDGANAAGILAAIDAKPVTATTVTNSAPIDVDALATAIAAKLTANQADAVIAAIRAQYNK